MTTRNCDPLDVSLREFLARMFEAPTGTFDPDRWIDVRDPQQCPVPWRSVMDAARRGELDASRVGRQVLVRARELDRWLAAKRIETRVAEPAPVPAPPPAPSRVAHLLDRAGYLPRARTKP